MTTQHKVNATHLWYHAVVIVINLLTHLPTKVRDAYHYVALLHVLQIVSPALSLYSRVEIFHALTVMVEDKSFKWRTKSEESYLHAVTLDNGVWFHDTFENCAGEVVVGAYDRKSAILNILAMFSIPKSNSWLPIVATSYFIMFMSFTSTSPWYIL